MPKFYSIDPNKCSIKELEEAIATCENRVEYFGSLEQGCKKFINSVYGALGSKFYVCGNVDIAESVTLQGQDLIKYSVKCVNKFFKEYWNNLEKMFSPSVYLYDMQTNSVLFESICTHSRNRYIEEIPDNLSYSSSVIVIPILSFGTGLGYIKKKLQKRFNAHIEEKEYNSVKYIVVSEPTKEMLAFVNSNLSPYDRIANELKSLDTKGEFDKQIFVENCKNNDVRFNFGTGETCQVYGDSCTGDTKISYIIQTDNSLSTSSEMNISDLYDKYVKFEEVVRGKHFVRTDNLFVKNFDGERVIYSKVRHIIKHKVSKSIYRVGAVSGQYVDVTEDHSIIVWNIITKRYIEKRPECLVIGEDYLVIAKGDTLFTKSAPIEFVKKINECPDESCWVYDIEVITDTPIKHSFFGNDILIHNTDSVSYNSIIRTEKHPDGITISEFYDENIENTGETTLVGHESVHTKDKVLNYNSNDGLYYGNVERIIRHKVKKPKWILKAANGKIVECTDNHSLVVVRNGETIHVKPSDIRKGDKLIVMEE